MNHLSEEQMIDILMQEPHDAAWRRHLEGCDPCQERFQVITEGLEAARNAKPAVPLMPVPRITYDKYRRAIRRSRMTWLAAAAVLILSLSGFTLKIDGNGLNIQFGLPGMGGGQSAQVADLERQLELMSYQIAVMENKQGNFMAEVNERFDDSQDAYHRAAFQFEGVELKSKEVEQALVNRVEEILRKEGLKSQLKGPLQ
ncbi:MAG: hypothetical protein QNK37_18980 [Acidobacteriota bacterium]|nr:hypothetical protein [Acidobacteriota bacterium]